MEEKRKPHPHKTSHFWSSEQPAADCQVTTSTGSSSALTYSWHRLGLTQAGCGLHTEENHTSKVHNRQVNPGLSTTDGGWVLWAVCQGERCNWRSPEHHWLHVLKQLDKPSSKRTQQNPGLSRVWQRTWETWHSCWGLRVLQRDYHHQTAWNPLPLLEGRFCAARYDKCQHSHTLT